MPNELNEHTSCANTTVPYIWHQKDLQIIAKIISETKHWLTDIKKTLPVNYTYKKTKQVPKIGYQTATAEPNLSTTTGSMD